MSTTKQFTPITQKQIEAMGVQALADRPNAVGGHGQGGLSAFQLKLWFDKLVTLVADKLNEMQGAFSSLDAATYLRLPLDKLEIENVSDLIVSFLDGGFATRVMRVYPSAVSSETQLLQAVLNDLARSISDHEERISKNYIKGDRGDTGLMIMVYDAESETLKLRSENHLLTVENETLKLI